MSKIFDDLLQDENYKKLYDQLEEQDRAALMEAMKNLVSEFEKNFINPIASGVSILEGKENNNRK